MRINRSTSLLLSAAVAVAVAAPAVAGNGKGNDIEHDKYSSPNETVVIACEDDDEVPDTIKFDGDDILWPPNHKTTPIVVTAVGDADGAEGTADDTPSLATEGTHDEFFTNDSGEQEELNGAGNTDTDVDPAADSDLEGTDTGGDGEADEAVTSHQVRSERSGRGDGRTYTIHFQAQFEDSGETFEDANGNMVPGCEDSFELFVPHDMRGEDKPNQPKSPSLNEDGSPKGGNGNG